MLKVMTKKEIVDRLEELVRDEDIEKIIPEVEKLESEFEQEYERIDKERLEAFKAEGNDPILYVPPKDPEDGKFKEAINLYTDRKNQHFAEKKEQEKQNYEAKKAVVQELKELIDKEENIGRAFQVFRELREKWKNTGDVSVHKYKDLQRDYRKEVERFHYHINIYKELKSHDLKRNYDLKSELADKIAKLLEEKDIKDIQRRMPVYQDEWDEIGPVTEEKWEELKERFWTATNAVYDKIKDHYKNLRDQKKENLQKKKELCEKVEQINEEEITSHKQWKSKTDEVINAQKQWKKTGAAKREKEQVLWDRFREACDQFFEKKSQFYEKLKEDYSQIADRKRKLIDKVKVIEVDPTDDNIDWKTLSDEVIQVQKRWKSTGTTHPKEEQKLWKEFRAVCDDFFNRKKEYFATLGDRQKVNLKKKEEIIDQINSYSLTGDTEKDKEKLKKLSNAYNEVGHVPKNDINNVSAKYNKALDKKYSELGLDKVEKAKEKFSSKVDSLKDNVHASSLLNKEKSTIDEKIKKLEASILQYENNLGFFGHSKGAEEMKKEVENNIENTRLEVKALKEKRKLVSISLRELD